MRYFLPFFVVLGATTFVHAQQIEHSNNAGIIGGGGTLDLGTLTNGDLAGNNVITVDATISRTEGSGGDSWLSLGINSAGGLFDVPLNGNVGWLTRTRTDAAQPHQLFDAPGATQSSGSADNSLARRTTATISLGAGGINNGDFADIVVRYDDGNNGSVDHILGGSFDFSANSANFDMSSLNKSHNFDVTISSGLQGQFSIFDTGVDSTGTVLAPGSADPHWDITSTPGGGAFGDAVVQSNHPAWLTNDSAGTVGGTSWISTVPAGTTNIPQGNYTFEQTFSLDGFDPDTAVLVLDIAVDNSVTDILLNGNSLGISASGFGDFDANGPFEIASGFVAGDNVLEILMSNAGGSPNPGGLRVNILQATASPAVIPEPTSIAIWSLLGLALTGLGYHCTKRKK